MQLPHLAKVTIQGIDYEAIVMKHDAANGDLYFIRVDHMDGIDRSRMKTILSKRDAGRLPLWDILDQTALPNGENALVYFDQYVHGMTITGQLFKPQMGRRGPMLQAPPQPIPNQVPQQPVQQSAYIEPLNRREVDAAAINVPARTDAPSPEKKVNKKEG